MRTLLAAAVAVAIVSAGSSVPLVGQTAAQAPETLTGAVNYTRVDSTVACGGDTKPEAFPELKQRGFKAVINLRLESEPNANIAASRQAAEAAGLKYLHIPFDSQQPSPQTVDAFLAAVKDPAHSPVYIHCMSANRVGAVWLVKRVLVDGWDAEKATKEAEQIGLRSAALKAFALDYIASHKG